MSIYQSVLKQLPDLSKFYRIEGGLSYSLFQPDCTDTAFSNHGYIYFSKTMAHHQYYVTERLLQYIREILKEYQLSLNCYTIANPVKFERILEAIYYHPMKTNFISITCHTSSVIQHLLEENYIFNNHKKGNDRRIESCDTTKYQGGFGFCDEWLNIFNLFTYFYSFQSISKNDIIQFLIYRKKRLFQQDALRPTFFLETNQKIVKINQSLFNDYKKYELLNSLQLIVEQNLFFPHSVFSENPREVIKSTVQKYNEERKRILTRIQNQYDEITNS